jgi:CubicO group peptidase (beta-lactamase class C family)
MPISPADKTGLIDAAREFIPHVMRKENVPGLNIALGLHGAIIWEEGFGYADLSQQRPMTPKTVMRSRSMGKTYTATAVMQLVEQGIIGLHQPINDFLDFPITNPLGEREITAYDLLTHRSGLAMNTAAHSTFGTPAPLPEHLPGTYAGTHHENYDGRTMPVWGAKVGDQSDTAARTYTGGTTIAVRIRNWVSHWRSQSTSGRRSRLASPPAV